jgi:hypothetical protein
VWHIGVGFGAPTHQAVVALCVQTDKDLFECLVVSLGRLGGALGKLDDWVGDIDLANGPSQR